MVGRPSKPTVWAIVGPTCSGKTERAVEIAERIGGEIVSVDSAQIFQDLDIGTAKPTAEERRRARHHAIDVVSANVQWTAADFAAHADIAIAGIYARGRRVVLCGGTGLWYRALIRGVFEAPAIDAEIRAEVRRAVVEEGSAVVHRWLASVDPVAAARLHPNDAQRIGRALEFFRSTGEPISGRQDAHGFRAERYPVRALALEWDRAVLIERIVTRTRRMYADGLIEETAARIEAGTDPHGPGLSIIGYRDAVGVLEGRFGRSEAAAATEIATRQYAKRQRNWFRSEPGITWIDGSLSAQTLIERFSSR